MEIKRAVLPAFMSLMLTTSACTERGSSIPAPTPRTIIATPIVDTGLPIEVMATYPELLQTRLKVKSGGEVSVQSGVPTHIYNMTDLSYHPETAQEVYKQVEDIIDQGLYYNFPEGRMLLRAHGYSDVKYRKTLIVPKATPKPKQWITDSTIDFSKVYGWTNKDRQNLGWRTFIEATTHANPSLPALIRTIPGNTTGAFAVEACQQVVHVVVYDLNDNEEKDESLTLTGQEVFCNVLGFAIASRLLGIPYPEYTTSLNGLSTIDRRTNILSNKLVPIPISLYESIKITGPIIN